MCIRDSGEVGVHSVRLGLGGLEGGLCLPPYGIEVVAGAETQQRHVSGESVHEVEVEAPKLRAAGRPAHGRVGQV